MSLLNLALIYGGGLVIVGFGIGMTCMDPSGWPKWMPHPAAVWLMWPLAFCVGVVVSAGVVARWGLDMVFRPPNR